MRPTTLYFAVLFTAGVPVRAEGPTFDAASVTLMSPDLRPPYTITGGPGANDPGRFRAPGLSLFDLVSRAFGVSPDQIAGPAWLRDRRPQHFTVVATMPPGTTPEQFEKMFQNLLVERFHLVFHRETRNFPGYELVTDKGGPKVKAVISAASGGSEQPAEPRPGPRSTLGADGFPNLSGPRTISMARPGGGGRTKYQERTMAEFASSLGPLIATSQGGNILDGSPQPRVLDHTGLNGKYTFILEYSIARTANPSPRFDPEPGRGAQGASERSSR